MNVKKTIVIAMTAAILTTGNAFAAGNCCAAYAACCEVQAPCCVQSTAAAATVAAPSLSSLEAQLVNEVNRERAKYGLPALTVSSELTRAAGVRGREISGKFSHTRPDGSAWKTVSAQARGENIARGHKSVQRVMAAWMSSPGHRKNILRQSFGSIGVSAVNVGGVMHWVQLFGK